MKNLIVAIVALFITLSYSTCVKAEVAFPEWFETQAKKYQDDLQSENAALSSQDISRVQERLKKAKASEDWSSIVTEYAHLAGKFPDKIDYWIQLSLALQKKDPDHKDWNNTQNSKFAAQKAYRLAQTAQDKEKQALALLAYGNNLSPDETYETPSYNDILQEITKLVDINAFKKSAREYADLMPFILLNPRVNNQSSTPSACFSFSHALIQNNSKATDGNTSKTIRYSDYVTVEPKVDGEWIVNGRELCLSPLTYGENYNITFKKGLPSQLDEKLSESLNISLKVKDQNSRLSFSNKAYVLMQNEKALIPLTSVNVDSVKLKILYISDRGLNQIFTESSDFLRTLWDYRISEIAKNQGELLWEGEMEMGGEKNKTNTLQVPFFDAVKSPKPGVYIIQAEEKGALYGDKALATQWLILSDMALTSFSSSDTSITVNVRSLKSALPLANVEVQLLAANNIILDKVKTNKDGIAFFESSKTRGVGGNRPRLILAYGSNGNGNGNNGRNSNNGNHSSNGRDFSFLDLGQSAFDLSDRGVAGRKITGNNDAYLYTEQGVYRPGDTVHLNALLRDNLGLAKGELPLTFSIIRPDNIEVSRETLTGNTLGFYELKIPLSSSSRTGQWTVLALLDPKKPPIGQAQFSVEDFVPSRLLITLKGNQPILTPNNPIQVTANGKYLFGVVASGLAGTATLTLREQNNPYPQYPGFKFGLSTENFTNTRADLVFPPLDKNGESIFKVALDKVPETSKPLEAIVRVTLADPGGRPEIGTLNIPVRVSPFLIGLKPLFNNNAVSLDASSATFEVISVDKEGKYQAIDNLEYQLFAEELQYTWYQPENERTWTYKATVQDKFLNKGTLNTKDNKAATLEVALQDWGGYRIEIKDPKTGIQSSYRFSKGWMQGNDNGNSPDRLNLKIDKENYKVGETAEVWIQSPFDGEALLTLANNKVLETRNIKVSKKGDKIKLNVSENWGVGVYCMVSAFRPLKNNTENSARMLPKRAIGITWLGMNTAAKSLDINMQIPKEILPKQTLEVPIQVTPEEGKEGVDKTMLTIAAVDEGILKLTEFKTPYPQNYFFAQQLLGVDIRDLYGKLIEQLPGETGVLKVGGDGGALSRNLQALSKRSFKVVSLYSGAVDLDKEGKGLVKFEIPEFNGTLRLMAVAFDKKRLGSQETSLLVRDPIILEGVLPRFLAPQDQSTFSLSLYNVKGEAGDYQLKLETEGEITLKNGTDAIRAVKLEKDASLNLAIPIEAKAMGDGKIRVSLSNNADNTSSKINISNSFEISVRPKAPFSNKAQAKSLKTNESNSLNSDLIKDFVPGTEEIILSWSDRVSWDTAALLKNLAQYPYTCVEQTTSKGFGGLLASIHHSEKNSVQNPAQNAARVNQALAVLSEKQNPNGSFNLWFDAKSDMDVWLTAYVVDFLQKVSEQNQENEKNLAKNNISEKNNKNINMSVPKFTLERALDSLQTYVERNNSDNMDFEGVAYALYVLSKTDRIEAGAIRYFYDTYYDKLQSSLARAFIAAALAEKNDQNRALAAFQELYNIPNDTLQYAPYGSALRDKSAIITLAIASNTKMPALNVLNDTINGWVQTLSQEIGGLNRLSTQEDVWLLLAAKALYTTPDMSASPSTGSSSTPSSVLINNKPSDAQTIKISTQDLQSGIEIKNIGSNSIWQQVLVSGIPKTLEAKEEGVAITRQYYDLEGNTVDPASIKQGKQMVVVLEAKPSDTDGHQWLLVDYLPAGFEIENARINLDKNNSIFPWLEGMSTPQFAEARDDRFVGSVLTDEKNLTVKLAYVVRAVTIGKYVHPGVLIEDMYTSKIYARTDETATEVLPP